jgi:hypothetical protein
MTTKQVRRAPGHVGWAIAPPIGAAAAIVLANYQIFIALDKLLLLPFTPRLKGRSSMLRWLVGLWLASPALLPIFWLLGRLATARNRPYAAAPNTSTTIAATTATQKKSPADDTQIMRDAVPHDRRPCRVFKPTRGV